jgi:hypothetical protein
VGSESSRKASRAGVKRWRGTVLARTQTSLNQISLTSQLGFGGQVLADTLEGVALAVVEGEEFEAVAESLTVANDGPNSDGIRSQGQRNVESDDFAGFEAAGKRGADTVLTQFGGASPAGAELTGLEHLDLQADVDGEAGESSGEGDLRAPRMV